MTNQNPAQGYEIGILNQLIKNSEAIAVTQLKVEVVEKQTNKIPSIETRLDSIETRLDSIENRLDSIEKIGQKIINGFKWIVASIILGIFINILSTPLITNLFH